MEKPNCNSRRGGTKTSSFARVVALALAGATSAVTALGEMPARYVPLDWLDTTGVQWILTDYVPKCTDRFEMSVRLKSLDGTQCFYCSRGTSSTALTMTAFLFAGNSWRFDRKSNGTAMSEPAPEIDVDYVIVDDFATRECTINGTPVYTNGNAEAFTAGSPLALFASHEAGMSLSPTTTMGNYAQYRFYSFRVYDVNGKLVREFLPAFDTQSADVRSQCGVYETQNGTFYPNCGEFPFFKVGRGDLTEVLDGDASWPTVGVHCGYTVDLNGHTLRLGACDAPIAITNTSETCGTLVYDCATDTTNYVVTVNGNVRVAKEGAGVFGEGLYDQLYTGGFTVREGTMQLRSNSSQQRLGVTGGTVTAEQGTVIDMNGIVDMYNYTFVLNGGMISNSVAVASPWSKAMVANVRLGADSKFVTRNSAYGFINTGYNPLEIDLQGHTLTVGEVDPPARQTYYFSNVTTTEGTLVLNEGVECYNRPCYFTNSLVVVNGQFNSNSNCSEVRLGDCEVNTPTPCNHSSYAGAVKVYGSLRPNTDCFRGCEMQDGSTLDLRGRTMPFSTRSRNTANTAAQITISFAANATVTVNLEGRALAGGMCIVKWAEQPDATTTFAFDAATTALGFTPAVMADGLYASSGANTYPITAMWTGAANDGVLSNAVNWSCTNFNGEALSADTLPAAQTELIFTGDLALQIPSDPGISFGKMVFEDCRLSADCDWRGLGTVNVSGMLDLDGHTLCVAGLSGDGTITSSFDLTVPELGRATTSTTLIRNTVPGNLFTNNFEWAQDAVHRLICEHKALPCVIDYDFGDSTLITAYKIHVGPYPDANSQDGRAPRDWQFLGSDDKENWTLLDERTNVVDWAGWECRTFTFANATAYRYYRISISEAVNPSNGWMEFVQLEYGLAEKGFGTVQIDVPAGEEAANDGVAIDGNVRVEKTGGGLFTAKKAHQSYNMGTVVSAGSLRCGTADAAIGRGRVTVCAGAVLDLGADVNYKTGVYSMDLAGTVIATNAATQCVFGSISLSGDATIIGRDESFSFRSASVPPSLLALNGHTLTIEANGFVYLGVWHDDGTPGRLVLHGTEGTRFESSDALDLASYAVEVTGGAVLKGWRDLDVGDFVYGGTTWQLNSDAFAFGVHGKFAPGEMYPALTMCDGSTLDLSQKTGTWNADGIAAVAGSGNPRVFTEPGLVSFASGATVTIDVHGRTFSLGEKIISWAQKPEGTVFAFDDATAAGGVTPVAGETGLFYGTNGAVERAVWTGAADADVTNPANWTCTDITGAAVLGGLPGAGSIVRIEGSVAMQIPASAPLACERLEIGDCTLTADCNWRGLDFSTCSGGTIDLRGHKLYVNGLGGAVTVTDTTEHYEILDYLNVESGAWVNTGYTPNCTDRVHAKVRLADVSNNKCIYCSRTMSGSKVVRTFTCFAISNKFRFDRNSSNTSSTLKLNATTDYELAVDYNTLAATINGGNAVTIGGTGTYTPGSPVVLFSAHNASPGTSVSAPFVGRFYYFRVFNADGNIVREYLPARRSTDGVIGLWETTQHTFLTNTSSTGALTAGDNVICMTGLNPGELHVDVPQGVTNENYATVLSGNLRLVKEGAGTFVGGKSGQKYGGGTVVAGGTARPRTGVQNKLTYYEAQYFFGGEYSKLTIESGAVFDIAGHFAYRVHDIVPNGGTLANLGPDQTDENFGGIGNLTLTADSTLDLQCSTEFYGSPLAAFKRPEGGRIELGNHTLTVRIGSGKMFRLGELAWNGTIHVTGDGYFRTYLASTLDMPTLDLRLSDGAIIWQGMHFTVRSFAMAETTNQSVGIYPVNVLERCQPGGDGFYGCVLKNGAVLDLSQCNGELQARSRYVKGCDSTTYEPNSTITIHLGERQVRNKERLVAWYEQPENVTFVLDEESRNRTKCRIAVKEDGVYVVRKGLVIIVQ